MLSYHKLSEEDYIQAFNRKEFFLAYQPIINFHQDQFETFEAFIRWAHPKLGTLPPSMFMSHIGRYHLSNRLTAYILERATAQILNNSQAGYGQTGISVNLSLQEFHDPNTIQLVRQAAAKIPSPDLLGIEVSPKVFTEYAAQNMIADPEYHPDDVPTDMEIEFLKQLKPTFKAYNQIGVTLALDTTEHIIGSLIRADIMQIDAIKVKAKTLQKLVLEDPNNAAELIKTSEDFQIPLIIVGIEDRQILQIAYHNGFTYGQGLLICEPLCLKNPKEFFAHLNKYYAAKEDYLQVPQNINNLKEISEKLIKERPKSQASQTNQQMNKTVKEHSMQASPENMPQMRGSMTYPQESKVRELKNASNVPPLIEEGKILSQSDDLFYNRLEYNFEAFEHIENNQPVQISQDPIQLEKMNKLTQQREIISQNEKKPLSEVPKTQIRAFGRKR